MRSLKTAIINLDTDAAAFPKVIDHRAGGLLQKDFARTDQQKDFEKMARRSMPHANAKLLKTLERYGVVTLNRESNRLIPKVHATDFKVEFGLNYSSRMAA